MAGPKYPLTIRYRATHADARVLKRLAEHYGRTESDLLRLLVAEAWRRAKGHTVAPPVPRKVDAVATP